MNFGILAMLVLAAASPLSADAALVPCGIDTNKDGVLQGDLNGNGIMEPQGGEEQCDFGMLIVAINNVISFLLFTLALPLSAIMFAYAGWLYLTSGGGEAKGKAKKILVNVFVGLVIALAAFLIVNTIMKTLVRSDYKGVNILKQ